MSRPFRLWVRCPPDDQNPDGFRIADTYVQFTSAVRAGWRCAGRGNFHVDHTDPNYLIHADEQQVYGKKKQVNGRPLFSAKVKQDRAFQAKLARVYHL